jgi:hypothetical protein
MILPINTAICTFIKQITESILLSKLHKTLIYDKKDMM